MRKVLVLCGLVLCFTFSAAAQDTPAGELFGGYSYLRVNPGSGLDGFNLHGWNASLSGSVNQSFAIVGDFAGHYGEPFGGGVNVNNHTFLFGPKFTARGGAATPFVHALFGFARASGAGIADRAFAMALGGGVDWNVGQHAAIRIVQADYLMTRFDKETQNNFRLSFGIVAKLGSR